MIRGLCQFSVRPVVNKLFSPVSDAFELVSIVDPKAVHPPVEFSKLDEEIALDDGLKFPSISFIGL